MKGTKPRLRYLNLLIYFVNREPVLVSFSPIVHLHSTVVNVTFHTLGLAICPIASRRNYE
jgi:hypothetical protein